VRAAGAGVGPVRQDVRLATNVGGITVNVGAGADARETATALAAGLEEQTEQALDSLNRRMVPRVARGAR
jgi:hypothetical protein